MCPRSISVRQQHVPQFCQCTYETTDKIKFHSTPRFQYFIMKQTKLHFGTYTGYKSVLIIMVIL